jgi:hypothetical protein
MALLKVENRWINPAHVMALREQGSATEVYLADPNHQGLNRADFLIARPIDEVGKLLNEFIKNNRVPDMALLRVTHGRGRTFWINSAHVSRLEAGQHLPNSTAIYLVDPTSPGVAPDEDLIIPLPLDELAQAFNDAIRRNLG